MPTIIEGSGNFDLVAWVKEKAAAQTMADAHYRNAVLLRDDAYKIAFFDSIKRVKDIEYAIEKYLGVAP
jgi:hypothetical protein